ncbi:MAG: AAA family ATPase [Treponema sp.]|jgi:DNA polymerase III delta prime subunit|nr:AAA family ATPase [Treponema sp.]
MTEFAAENSGLKEARKRIKHFFESWEMELDLSDLGLERFPLELIDEPDIIHGLNLSGNKLEELPAAISVFTSLEMIDLSGNRLSKLPEAIVNLQNLKRLKVNDNDLTELPENIDRLSLLETLDVSRNRLTHLPDGIKNLRRLKNFDFNLNKLDEAPNFVKKFTCGKKTNILLHIRKLADMASGNENVFSDIFFERSKAHLKAVMERFHLTPVQAVIYAQFLLHYEEPSIYLREIASAFNLCSLEMLPYVAELEELENKKLLFCRHPGGGETTTYRIPPEVIESLRLDKPYKIEAYEHVSIDEFFEITDKFFDLHGNNELSYSAFITEIQSLINNNTHLSFCKKIREANLDVDDMILLLRFCQRLVSYDDDSIGISDIGGIFNDIVFKKFVRLFRRGEFELITRGFVEMKEINDYDDEFFGDTEIFSLTPAAKADFLGELDLKPLKKKDAKKDSLIPHGSITAKKMFYNKKEDERIHDLFSVLSADNFKVVQERLVEKGLRSGFVCLFSGAPGTGKTETAYQLARETGRDLMAVNITDIQSKWVGESEKNLKMIFEDYREAVQTRNRESARIPILLFNEADGVISKRFELGSESRSVDQMMNSLQNIILEEMEKLPGILIATTNLVQNMDKAFERRFLYKIEFEKPEPAVRRSIWQNMLPALHDNDAEALAARFEFSGGQIENITRKSIADYVLTGVETSFENLLKFCKEELLTKQSERRIGFASEP